MAKTYTLPDVTATVQHSDKTIIAQIKHCKWTFDFEGCNEGRLVMDAAGNGWVVKAQSLYRAAIMATRVEDYAGPSIEAINNDWTVKTFNVLNDFKLRTAKDPVPKLESDMLKQNDDVKQRLIEKLQASMKSD